VLPQQHQQLHELPHWRPEMQQHWQTQLQLPLPPALSALLLILQGQPGACIHTISKAQAT
jgi:hypothetical protein